MKIVLVTGGFDPIHSGHILYLQEAKKLGDLLVVGVNSDSWLERKKGRSFMPFLERINILQNIKCVDFVTGFDDNDGSAKHAIRLVRQSYPHDKIIFANGGDRIQSNTLEIDTTDSNIEFMFGVGGEDKKNSSSWILNDWSAPKTKRPWGYYRILHNVSGVKVKELTVKPWHQLSMQRHYKRNEFWMVTEGEATIKSLGITNKTIKVQEHTFIPKEYWHQLWNNTSNLLKIVEIQYGEDCIEEDIERFIGT